MSNDAQDIVLRSADVSNHPELIDQFGVIGVNSAIEFDIYGNVNSTHVGGKRMINGVGGLGDFNRNALLTICALPSTHDDGDVSRVVPMTFHVDHTERDIDIFVTEQGVADVRGWSPVERAELIIENYAHPSFESRLRDYLESVRSQHNHVPTTSSEQSSGRRNRHLRALDSLLSASGHGERRLRVGTDRRVRSDCSSDRNESARRRVPPTLTRRSRG
ncbi:acetyl-CoA hydrolase/transferase C-terminal domain-containing protein [Natrinema versiforme]|uniref:acetyl-CoA hydrolase/transferase C-terminal domain-containing protein n=1 Tax=Natrinema versiforme TaxID=88724 RepID=UPI0019311611|nr:acetyl-CoA hydrolase/transferase C-terminal domain-containing protein [Natrinema versiforme]